MFNYFTRPCTFNGLSSLVSRSPAAPFFPMLAQEKSPADVLLADRFKRRSLVRKQLRTSRANYTRAGPAVKRVSNPVPTEGAYLILGHARRVCGDEAGGVGEP